MLTFFCLVLGGFGSVASAQVYTFYVNKYPGGFTDTDTVTVEAVNPPDPARVTLVSDLYNRNTYNVTNGTIIKVTAVPSPGRILDRFDGHPDLDGDPNNDSITLEINSPWPPAALNAHFKDAPKHDVRVIIKDAAVGKVAITAESPPGTPLAPTASGADYYLFQVFENESISIAHENVSGYWDLEHYLEKTPNAGVKHTSTPTLISNVAAYHEFEAYFVETVPTISIPSATVSVAEGGKLSVLFKSNVPAPPSGVTIDYDVQFIGATPAERAEPADIAPVSGTIELVKDETEVVLEIGTVQDTIVEPDETLLVKIETVDAGFDIDGANDRTEGTILNDGDQYTVSISGGGTYNEIDQTFDYTVKLDQAGELALTVDYRTEAGTPAATIGTGDDVEITGTSVAIPAGATTALIPVQINADTVVEGDEVFRVVLDSATGAPYTIDPANDTAQGVILNDDEYTFAINDQPAINESAGTVTFEVTLDQAGEAPTAIDYTVSGVSASMPADFNASSGKATFPPGVTTYDIVVTIVGDNLVEPDETFEIALEETSITGGPGQVDGANGVGEGTILNDDKYSISIGNALNRPEGASGDTSTATFTVTLTGAGPVPVVVPFTMDADTDSGGIYSAEFPADVTLLTSSPLTLGGANPSTAEIQVQINGDDLVEFIEKFWINLDIDGLPIDPLASNTAGLGTIANDDTYQVSIADNTSIPETDVDSTAPFVISVTGTGERDITVNYEVVVDPVAVDEAEPTDFTATTDFIDIPAGTPTGTIMAGITGDTIVENNETFMVRITSITGPVTPPSPSEAEAIGTIIDNDEYEVSVDTISVAEADGTATFTVTLDQAGEIGVNVEFTIGDAADTAKLTDDYTILTVSPLVFAPSDTSKPITVNLVDDGLFELTETFSVELTAITDAPGTFVQNTGVATITDTDDYEVSLVETAVSVTEGTDPTLTLTIALDQELPEAVSVPFSLSDIEAEDGTDYNLAAASPNPVVIAAGDTSKQITIEIVDDDLYELTENFKVDITAPTYGIPALGNTTANVAIADNGDTYQVYLTETAVSVTEADGASVTFTIELDQPLPGAMSVPFTLTPQTAQLTSDYAVATVSPVPFAAGETSNTFSVDIVNDDAYELSETFKVDIQAPTYGNPTLGDATATVQIDDTDTYQVWLDETTVSVTEALGASVTLTIKLDQALPENISVPFTLTEQTAELTGDYTPATASPVPFTAGDTSKTFTVDIVNDDLYELSETFKVDIQNPAYGNNTLGNTTATVEISDTDTYQVSLAETSVSVTEGSDSSVTFTIELDQALPEAISVPFTLTEQTAKLTGDYTEATVSPVPFAAGQTSRQFTVDIVDDGLYELSETFKVDIQNPAYGNNTLGNTTATVEINDTDTYQVWLDETTVSVTEALGASVTFTIKLDQALPEDISVPFTLTEQTAKLTSDYAVATVSPVPFVAGEMSKQFTVDIVNDDLYELSETFKVDIQDPAYGNNTLGNTTAVVEIDETDTYQVTLVETAASVTEGTDPSVTFTIELDQALPEAISVPFTLTAQTAELTDDFAAATTSPVPFAAGQTSKTFTVDIVNDDLYELTETFRVDIQDPAYGNNTLANTTADVSIADNGDTYQVSLAETAVSVTEADGASVTFTIELDQALPEDMSVPFTLTPQTAQLTSDYAAATVSPVSFVAGETSKQFTVDIVNDDLYELSETFKVDIQAPTYGLPTLGNTTATVEINETDTYQVQLDETALSVTEAAGASVTLTITLDQALPEDISVPFTLTEQTAELTGDYTVATASPLSFTAGETTKQITVDIVDDDLHELSETFKVDIQAPAYGNHTFGNTTATVEIDDVDTYEVWLEETALTVAEAAGASVTFTIKLDQALPTDISVPFSLSNMDAEAGSDYNLAAASPNPLPFAAGETVKQFTVDIVDDTWFELTENFRVDIQAPIYGNHTFANTMAVVEITDTDTYQVWLDETTASVTEAAGASVTLTVKLDQALPDPLNVPFTLTAQTAGPGSDYNALTVSPVTIPAGETSRQITIEIVDDTLYELTETFKVDIQDPGYGLLSLGNTTTEVEILETDTYQVSLAETVVSVTEGTDPSVTFTIALDQALPEAISVPFTLSDLDAEAGSDYNLAAASLNPVEFAAGDTSKQFTVEIVNDDLYELTESFQVDIQDPAYGNHSFGNTTASVAIADNGDTYQVSLVETAVSATEGTDPTVTFTIELDQVLPDDISVPFTLSDIEAVVGSDYNLAAAVVNPVPFAAGETSKQFTIEIVDDDLYELTENFQVDLQDPVYGNHSFGNTTANVAIADNNDTYQITLDAALKTVTEGIDGGVTFTVTLDQAVPDDIIVPISVNEGTAQDGPDFVNLSPTSLVFTAGEQTKPVTIAIVDDDLYEDTEDFSVAIGNPVYGHHTIATGSADCQINDDPTDTYQATLSGGTTVAENAGTVSLTVNLDQPVPGGATIPITLGGTALLGAGLDYTITPDTLALEFNDTETSKTIDLAIVNDSVMELDETIEVGLTTDAHRTTSGSPQTVSITNEDTFAVSVSGPATVNETDGTATFIVTLDQMVPDGVTFDLDAAGSGTSQATAGTDFSLAATTLTFSNTETTKPVVVNLTDDGLVEILETFDLTVETTHTWAAPKLSDLTCAIASEDGYRISINDIAVNEADGSATFTVTVNPVVGPGHSVNMDYTTDDGTAKDGVDYTHEVGSLTFGEGQTTKTIEVSIEDNAIDAADSPLDFYLLLGNNTSTPPGGSFFDKNNGRCDITDNDVTVTFLVDGNGKVSNENPYTQVITIGADADTAVAQPDPDHFLYSWMGDFSGDYTVPSVTLTGVTENKTVTAIFKEKPKVNTIVEPDIDLIDVFHGEISPGGKGDNWVHMEYLTDNTFEIAPELGFCTGNVTVDGIPMGQITDHTFTAVDRLAPDYYTIYATFRDRFTLTGQIDPRNSRSGSGGAGTFRVIDAATDGTEYDSGWLIHNERVEVPCDIDQVKVQFSDQTGWETPAEKTLTLTEDQLVAGWYRPILTVVSSDGQVTGSDAKIACPVGADCTETYDYNAKVTLTAAADTGYVFTDWEGDLDGSSPLATFFMDKPRTITAVYAAQTASNADADKDGWSIEDGDCDDSDNRIYPTAAEQCDGIDYDCDDLTNLTDPIDPDCEDAELGLANLPLDTLLQPAPATIMFVMDDSGSMDFELSNPATNTEDWNTIDYIWDDDNPGRDNTYPASWRYLPTADRGYWRTQWSDHNRMYYNPQIEYLPWRKDDGSRFNYADLDTSGSSIWPKVYQDPNKHNDDYSISLTDVYWSSGDSIINDPDFDTNAIIIDSHDPGLGTFTLDNPSKWREVTGNGAAYNNNFYDTGKKDDDDDFINYKVTRKATWTPPVLTAGYYNVYAYWRDTGWYDSQVDYTIHHKTEPSGAKTTTTITVNQEDDEDQWNRLGDTYYWIDETTDPKVVLEHTPTDKKDKDHACADAVAFLKVGSAGVPVTNAHYYVTINKEQKDGLGNVVRDSDGNIVYETDTHGVPIPESIYLVTMGDGIKYYEVSENADQFITSLVQITDPADVPDQVKVPVREEIYAYADPANPTDTELWQAERRNFSNWFTYYRRRELTAKAAVGEVISGLRGVQVGFKFINSPDSEGVSNKNIEPKPVRISTMDADTGEEVLEHYDNLLADFYDFDSSGGTPLRQAFEEVGEFFDLTDSSDGGFGKDTIGPWYLPAADGSSRGGECQQAFAILLTDGYYNGGGLNDIGNEDGDIKTPVDTSPETGHGNYLYADNWTGTLADIAMKYYLTDLSPTLDDLVPPSEKDFDTATYQHLVTYTVSFGLSGLLDQDEYDLYNDSPDLVKYPAWPDPFQVKTGEEDEPAKIDDMWHAAVNGRGQYLNAQNPKELVDSMKKILENMLSRIGSGSSLSINGEKLHTGTVMYQASYSTDGWEGDVKAFPVDPITGMVDTASSNWSASAELNSLTWDEREIATYNPGSGYADPNRGGIVFAWDSLTTAQQAALKDNPNQGGIQDQGEAAGVDRLEYLRGNHADEKRFSGGWLRNRSTKLGDIVHSAPYYVDYLKEVDDGSGNITTEKYGVLYASANDGMLHAFRSTDGKELFAYVPNLVFENLGGLTLPEPYFSHRYYVDVTPHIREVGHKVNGDFVSQKLLVGGLGKGGTGYFCLDVTAPDENTGGKADGNTEANADEWVKWEFPHADTDPAVVANMGYSYSEAYIVKSNIPSGDPDDKWKWVVIFGNGYASSTETAALYVVDAQTGELIREINTFRTGGNGMSSPTPVDVSADYRVDYVYVGDMRGNVWKFDLTDADPDKWGSAYTDPVNVDPNGDPLPVPLFTAVGRTKNADGTYKEDTNADDYWRQPITTKIVVTRHCDATQDGYIVLFGTGKNLGKDDLEDTRYQTIYGIWDYGQDEEGAVGMFNRGATKELSNLDSTASLLEQKVVYEDDVVRVLTDNKPTWVTDIGTGKPVSHAGWYFDLPISKERIIKNAMVRNGKLIIISSIPESAPCSAGGSSVVHEMDACSGSRLEEAQFDMNGDGVIDDKDYIVIKKTDPVTGEEVDVYLAPTGLKFDAMIHPPIILEVPGGETERKYFSTSAGTISTMEEQTEVQGMFYWRMIER